MLSPQQVLDKDFLDVRCMLLEIAATLDRYDEAVDHVDRPPLDSDPRLEKLDRALAILAQPQAVLGRAETLLRLFSDPVD